MIVFVIIGAGVANACVIEKATDVDIGAIELANLSEVEAIVTDVILTSKVNDIEPIINGISKDVITVTTVGSFDYTYDKDYLQPFYLSIYNDDHRSDWLNKETLMTKFDTDRQNQNTAYRRLRRVQHRHVISSC